MEELLSGWVTGFTFDGLASASLVVSIFTVLFVRRTSQTWTTSPSSYLGVLGLAIAVLSIQWSVITYITNDGFTPSMAVSCYIMMIGVSIYYKERDKKDND